MGRIGQVEYLRIWTFGTSISVLGINCVAMTTRYRRQVLMNKIRSCCPTNVTKGNWKALFKALLITSKIKEGRTEVTGHQSVSGRSTDYVQTRMASWMAKSSTCRSRWPVTQTLILEQTARSSPVNLRFSLFVKVQSRSLIESYARISWGLFPIFRPVRPRKTFFGRSTVLFHTHLHKKLILKPTLETHHFFQTGPWPAFTPLIIQEAAWHISCISVSRKRSERNENQKKKSHRSINSKPDHLPLHRNRQIHLSISMGCSRVTRLKTIITVGLESRQRGGGHK